MMSMSEKSDSNPVSGTKGYGKTAVSHDDEIQNELVEAVLLWDLSRTCSFRIAFELWILLDHIGEKIELDPRVFTYVPPTNTPAEDVKLAKAFGGDFLHEPRFYEALDHMPFDVSDKAIKSVWENARSSSSTTSVLPPALFQWTARVEDAIMVWNAADQTLSAADASALNLPVFDEAASEPEVFLTTVAALRKELGVEAMLKTRSLSEVPIEDICIMRPTR